MMKQEDSRNAFGTFPTVGCTGISLTAKDGSYIQARTIEGSEMDLPGEYVIIPRGQKLQSFTPIDANGMKFTAKYGVIGLSVVRPEFIAEGLNEKGLSCGLFFFPHFGGYAKFDEKQREKTIGDLQLNQWMLSQFATVEEVIKALKLKQVHIVGLDSSSTVHWRIGDASGRQIVLEIIDATLHIYENTVGVITNSPDFQWHLTNLNNYVNLFPGNAPRQNIAKQVLFPMGGNSGFLGMPGDATPPSRFVRAAFYCATAPRLSNAMETVKQCFHILNNFDIPIGIEHPLGKTPNIPSATHWTSVIDLSNRKVYFKTAYNSTVRCIDLNEIDFEKVKYQSHPFDRNKKQPIEKILIK
ncbi:MAG: choloylglycine hydrolase family protein [Bacteroidaceae bacterium]|nr:choloylglycine hydrolase family protein [Bacteroidaceae bacterium]